jgi:DNA-binding transcriptional LysR family regulator
MINVRHLAVFRAVMKTGSVSAAARVLNVSQPAITKTLQLVESRIGVPLFRRLKGRLHATAESMLLMPGVDQIFGAVEDVERLADEIAGGNVGRVSVATNATLSASVTAEALSRYRLRRPNVVIHVHALSSRQVIDEVANSQVDIGIVDAALGEGYLQSEELCKAYFGCVLPKDHRLAGQEAIEPGDLRDEALITFQETTLVGAILRERFRQLHTPLNIVVTTNLSLIACLLTRSGRGLALVDPFLLLSDLFPDLVMRPLKPAVELRPRIVFPPDRPLSIVAREFAETVKQTVADLVPTSPLLAPI